MRVLITGAAGMLGRTLVERFAAARPGDTVVPLTRADVDLSDRVAVERIMGELAPDAVVHTAAVVGGIGAKRAAPTRFLADNVRLDGNVLDAAARAAVPRLLYLSSAVVYPAGLEEAISESALLTGPLEPVNEGYGLAKIVGGSYCRMASEQLGLAWRAVAPSNLYGEHDDFRPATAHLVAAAVAKVHAAVVRGDPAVEVWGDGTALREFTYAGDLAEWLLAALDDVAALPPLVNVGSGDERSIAEYYRLVAEAAGFRGELAFDPSRPTGTPRRLLDSSRARELGWQPRTSLERGIASAYRAYASPVSPAEPEGIPS